jgi:hypothetical protein
MLELTKNTQSLDSQPPNPLTKHANTPRRFGRFHPFYRPRRPLGSVEVYLYSVLDLGTRRGWGVSVTPRPLSTPGKDPIPTVQEAVWAPGPFWTGAENLAPTGIRSPDRPSRSQSLPTELPGSQTLPVPPRNAIQWTSTFSPSTNTFCHIPRLNDQQTDSQTVEKTQKPLHQNHTNTTFF